MARLTDSPATLLGYSGRHNHADNPICATEFHLRHLSLIGLRIYTSRQALCCRLEPASPPMVSTFQSIPGTPLPVPLSFSGRESGNLFWKFLFLSDFGLAMSTRLP